MGILKAGKRDPERPRKGTHYIKATTSRIICRAQYKMKMWYTLVQTLLRILRQWQEHIKSKSRALLTTGHRSHACEAGPNFNGQLGLKRSPPKARTREKEAWVRTARHFSSTSWGNMERRTEGRLWSQTDLAQVHILHLLVHLTSLELLFPPITTVPIT